MNEIEKQILLNQVEIMRNLTQETSQIPLRLKETSDLLNPEEKPTLPERVKESTSVNEKTGKFAKGGKNE